MYLQFLSFFYIDKTQIVEILPREKNRTCIFHKANIMVADDLATEGARASTAMILT